MSYRCTISFELYGSYAQLDELQQLIPTLREHNKFHSLWSDVEIGNTNIIERAKGVYCYCFYNDSIKWSEYGDEFWEMWSKAEEMGIEGRFVYIGDAIEDVEYDEIGISKYGTLEITRGVKAKWLDKD